MKKIWQKTNNITTDALNEKYLVTKGVPDNELVPYDVRGSKAHANMLCQISLITAEENKTLQTGLDEILALWKAGKFCVRAEDEDSHTAIERFLTEKYGEAGKKIHTGRSRNDQVLVATRLMMKERLTEVIPLTKCLAEDFLKMANQYEFVFFPGYTHTQQAMLSSLGHYFASFVESLIDDIYLLKFTLKHVDQNPLGSAAGFGVAFPLDRAMTASELGFARIQLNSLYCQASRGKFEALVLESLTQVMLTLGRFAQDMLIFTSQEFNYFRVDESMTTGSSMMPQKRNLDYMEVLRGQVSLVIGNHQIVCDLTKNQLSGYNKDLKFVKKPLIESFEMVCGALVICQKMLRAITPDTQQIKEKITKGIFAADIANELVKAEGVPFRDAYKVAMNRLKNADIDYDVNLKSKISAGAAGNLQLEKYSSILDNI